MQGKIINKDAVFSSVDDIIPFQFLGALPTKVMFRNLECNQWQYEHRFAPAERNTWLMLIVVLGYILGKVSSPLIAFQNHTGDLPWMSFFLVSCHYQMRYSAGIRPSFAVAWRCLYSDTPSGLQALQLLLVVGVIYELTREWTGATTDHK